MMGPGELLAGAVQPLLWAPKPWPQALWAAGSSLHPGPRAPITIWACWAQDQPPGRFQS